MKIDIERLIDLSGKVAIVTGGGDGIGKGCAEILAAAGASVVVSNRHLDKAKHTVEEIRENGGTAEAFECDVLVEEHLQALVDFTMKTYGRIDILVNNAGLGGGRRENPFNIDRAYVERIYSINVFAPWELIKLAAPHMEEVGGGAVVNITSMSSVDREAGMGIYGSSKAALNHLAANLAYDYGPMGIRINNVGPGATRTAALATVLTPELEQKMLRKTPIRRLGKVSDIALAVLFFATPMSAWISGQTLMVNGGGDQTLD